MIKHAVAACFALSASALEVRAQQLAKWRLVEEWRVGGEVEGPHSFNEIRGLGLLPSGNIAVLDFKDQRLHILDAGGKPVRSVGRKGAGPGEMANANGFAIAPNGEIVVNDPQGNNRFTVFSATGDLVKTVPMTNRWGYAYIWDAYYNAAGRLDEYVSVRPAGATESKAARRVWSADLGRIDTVFSPTCPTTSPPDPKNFTFEFRSATGNMVMGIPLVSPGAPGIRGADGSFWAGVYPGFATIRHTPAGNCDADVTIQLKGSRLPVPAATRDSQIAGVQRAAARYGMTAEVDRIPREYPAYDALFVDPARRLWVERMTERGGRRFEIFTERGVQIAELDSPVKLNRYPRAVFTNERILGFVLDEDGIAYLVSLRIVRS